MQLPASEAPNIDYQVSARHSARRYYHDLPVLHVADPGLSRPTRPVALQFRQQRLLPACFSWLDEGLETNALFAGSVATNLTGWDSTNAVFSFPNLSQAPYVISNTVNVGDRISAPVGELGGAGDYWAGYIRQTNGTSFHPGVDP